MRGRDLMRLVVGSLAAHRMRSLLTASGIAVGITAVVLLTSIGTGIHQFVVSEFSQFGTHLINVQPGRAQTAGVSAGVFGNTRPLTTADAESLRRLPEVEYVVPSVQGNAEIEGGGRSRRIDVLGVGHEAPLAWRWGVAAGRFLPADDPHAPRSFAVLGAALKQELYGAGNALGEFVRIGSARFRVIGVMEPKGQVLGYDLDNLAYIPTQRALELFNRDGLFEVNVTFPPTLPAGAVRDAVRARLVARHGREDFTILTMDQLLGVLDSVLGVLTASVGALGAISLLVGGVGIFTIMTIAGSERVAEIGLLRAIGATRAGILAIFLAESIVLSLAGGLAGLLVGGGLALALDLLVDGLPVQFSPFFVGLSLVTAVGTGLVAGIAPARRAAALDPIDALRAD